MCYLCINLLLFKLLSTLNVQKTGTNGCYLAEIRLHFDCDPDTYHRSYADGSITTQAYTFMTLLPFKHITIDNAYQYVVSQRVKETHRTTGPLTPPYVFILPCHTWHPIEECSRLNVQFYNQLLSIERRHSLKRGRIVEVAFKTQVN